MEIRGTRMLYSLLNLHAAHQPNIPQATSESWMLSKESINKPSKENKQFSTKKGKPAELSAAFPLKV
jgi:hypothetical protein